MAIDTDKQPRGILPFTEVISISQSLGSCIFMENWKFFCKETKANKLFGCIRYDDIRAWS